MQVKKLIKGVLLTGAVLLYVVPSVQAAERFRGVTGDMPDYYCDPSKDYGFYKWGKLDNIVKPHLSVRGWSDGSSDAAEYLGLEVSKKKDTNTSRYLKKRYGMQLGSLESNTLQALPTTMTHVLTLA